MVKAVQAEDIIERYFEGLLKQRVQAEVGLLLGKPSVGSRDLALAVVPTPTQDGEQALTITAATTAAKPAKKGVKTNEPSLSITVDADQKDWITAHAQQVARMLPGGLSVLGLYLFAPDSGYSSCSSQLCDVLASIAADSSSTAALPSSLSTSTSTSAAAAAAQAVTATCTGTSHPTSSTATQEMLLLHIDSTSRKFTMRSCHISNPSGTGSNLKPCELKFGPSLNQLLCLQCNHSFNLTIPVVSGSATQMQQLLQDALAVEAVRVLSAVAAVEGRVIGSSSSAAQVVADLLPSAKGGNMNRDKAAVVDLYCLPGAASALASSSSSSSGFAGTVKLHGTIQAMAYVHKRDAITKAVLELKQDVVQSLAARAQLVLGDAADAEAEAAEAAAAAAGPAAGGGRPSQLAHPLLLTAAAACKLMSCGLPRRVLLPWEDLQLQVCDYLSDGEAADAAVERAQQLLHLQNIDASQVVELEAPAKQQQQQIIAGKAVGGTAGQGSGSSCSGPVMAATAAALVAAAAMAIGMMNLGG